MRHNGFKPEKLTYEFNRNKLAEMGGSGDIIAMDRKGNIAMELNTKGMYRGYIEESGKPVVYIFRDE